MHQIYTTPAFVVHSIPHGEAGKFLLLFTRDFGMIGVVAQGVRRAESKLRYHVQDSCFSDVSIVRGKEVWRLTGASELSFVKNNTVNPKILKLLKRLLHGEERNIKLFEIIEELYKTTLKEEDFNNVEVMTVLRVLNNLGYIKNNDYTKPFLEDNRIDDNLLIQFSLVKSKIISIVNDALKESQL